MSTGTVIRHAKKQKNKKKRHAVWRGTEPFARFSSIGCFASYAIVDEITGCVSTTYFVGCSLDYGVGQRKIMLEGESGSG